MSEECFKERNNRETTIEAQISVSLNDAKIIRERLFYYS